MNFKISKMTWFEQTEEQWRELYLDELKIDEAYLRVISATDRVTWLYTLSTQCYNCPFRRALEVFPGEISSLPIKSAPGTLIRIYEDDVGPYAFPNSTETCEFFPDLGEFGVYNLTITNDSACSFAVDKEPVNIYLPLLLIVLMLGVSFGLYYIGLYCYEKWKLNQEAKNNRPSVQTKIIEAISTQVEKPIASFFTYRGMAVVLMVLGNGGGGGYWWFERAPWNGIGLMDLVFPAFSWVLGAFIFKGIRAQINQGISRNEIVLNNAWHAIKLFAAGIFLNSISGPNLEDLRIMGILQRLGLASLIVGSTYAITSPRSYVIPQAGLKRVFWDIIYIKYLWLLGAMFTFIYTYISFFLRVPGCPRAYFGPGGLQSMLEYENCTGGASGYIDLQVLGIRQIHHHHPGKNIYGIEAFDSEGILGCFMTMVQTIMGLQCASTLQVFSETKSKMIRWMIWSLGLGLLSGVLCLFSWEEGWIPINRSLTSVSFVCLTSAIGFVLHAICHYLIDIKGVWSGSPFRQCGKNSLIIYMGHLIVAKMLPFSWTLETMNTHFVMLIKVIWTTGVWIALASYWEGIEFFFSL